MAMIHVKNQSKNMNDASESNGQKYPTRFGSFIQILKNFRELNLILIIGLICVIMYFASPYFATWGNIEAVLLSFSTDGIVVIGMTLMMIVGGIDVSVGAVMCFAMVVPGALFLAGMNPWVASIIGLLVSALLGAAIGFFITKVGLHPFITTLAIAVIVRGACLVVTQGTPLSLFTLPDSFKFIGQGKPFGIPFVIILFFIIVIICDFMLRRSTLLRKVFYTGSNEKAARFSGINVNKVKFWVCVLCSSLTGLAGVIYMARFSSATPIFGSGLEMTAISAAVIGGCSMSGGKGTVLGSILGVSLLALVTSSLILVNVTVYWQDLIKGLILLGAISYDSLNQMRKSK
jgi:ribose transport system permease protein